MPGGIHPPIEVVLAWPEPNYINPAVRPNTVTILACILGPTTVAMVLARLWVRIIIQRHPGWDDWIVLAATVSQSSPSNQEPTADFARSPPLPLPFFIHAVSVEMGFKKHIWDLNPIGQSTRMVTARKVTWLCIGFIAAYTVALTLAPILGCQPISAFWNQLDMEKVLRGYKFHCFDEGADVFAASVISSAQDLLTAVLPTFLYWNLRIPIRQKIALLGIFAIGYASVAIGAVRAYYSWRIFYETYDVTWWTWDLMLTCLLELHLGAFCANAPALKVFFKHFFHDKLDSTSYPRTPAPSGGHAHSLLTNSRSISTFSTVFSILSTFLSKSAISPTSDGYISEPHHRVFIDTHGGVQVHRDFQVVHSPLSTAYEIRHESMAATDLAYDRYYEEIELGRYTTGHNSMASSMLSTDLMEGNDLEALPPISRSPNTTMLPNSSLPCNADPQSSIIKALPSTLPSVLIEKCKYMSGDIDVCRRGDDFTILQGTRSCLGSTTHDDDSGKSLPRSLNPLEASLIFKRKPKIMKKLFVPSPKEEGACSDSDLGLAFITGIYLQTDLMGDVDEPLSMTTPKVSPPVLISSTEIQQNTRLAKSRRNLCNQAFSRHKDPDPVKWNPKTLRFPNRQLLYEILTPESVFAVVYEEDETEITRRNNLSGGITDEETANGGETVEGTSGTRRKVIACAAAIPWSGGWSKEGAGKETGWEIKTTLAALESHLMDVERSKLHAEGVEGERGHVDLWILAAECINGTTGTEQSGRPCHSLVGSSSRQLQPALVPIVRAPPSGTHFGFGHCYQLEILRPALQVSTQIPLQVCLIVPVEASLYNVAYG
ncbi:hypothetical protein LEMA_P002500.1 [Plenodomus lingam JN3]|uniref:Rhodopsin domain-containing protein n=1 Tax=Leptosphaeria maculans (strain JN3 / isolate v23.1.3 / race Av1-4-5-6-7-8) TaxID=985895 RepID=E5AE24_LEPMJ|nr:hypothetical protein LEMA_P002500.1 [Plenodomus lingam JN3]CBY01463.1 hypothetical protein LEMA_P002500.1 [Plenodomus lingam JN3]